MLYLPTMSTHSSPARPCIKRTISDEVIIIKIAFRWGKGLHSTDEAWKNTKRTEICW
uniref:Uncharacterized protein n=1 Tax=Octopus bimaculoides TaxID=37653 RepID=A0A0L8FMK8_OCTBM